MQALSHIPHSNIVLVQGHNQEELIPSAVQTPMRKCPHERDFSLPLSFQALLLWDSRVVLIHLALNMRCRRQGDTINDDVQVGIIHYR